MDRTVLEFPRGVTGVVGPNGCGKSNIVDAIRWVMGEQSPKQLRGQTMEDLIFAGNDRHPPLGFAEVSVVFDNEGRLSHLRGDRLGRHRDGAREVGRGGLHRVWAVVARPGRARERRLGARR